MTVSELQPYLNEIGRHPILSKEAQLRHCRRIRAWKGFTPEGAETPNPAAAPPHIERAGRRSMDTLVRTNLRLVVYVAKAYQNRGLDMLDLIQEGSLGLVRGLELFDPTRGYALSTYTFWWIRQAITRAIYNQSRPIRLPVNTQDKLHRVNRFIANYLHSHGTRPSLYEVATALDLDLTYLTEILHLYDVTHCVSLDAVTTADNPVSAVISCEETPSNSPEAALAHDTIFDLVHETLAALPQDQAFIIRETELKGRTLRDVSTELGYTRQRTSHLRNLAHNAMRYHLSRSHGVHETP